MTQPEKRVSRRAGSRRIEVVTVYRNRRDLSAAEAAARLDAQSAVYRLFSVVAEVHDISEGGVGIRFAGQLMRARNMLRAGERYLIKIPLTGYEEAPPALVHTLTGERFLLLKGQCRWYRPGSTRSSAGFALDAGNSPELIAFLRKRAGSDEGARPAE